MFIEQVNKFEFWGRVPLGCIWAPEPGNFYDKTKISKENLRVDYYLLLKYCSRQCTLLSPTRAKHRRSQDFWLGEGEGAKPQITCNDAIRNFERGIFCGGKDIVEWKIRSRGLVLARN